MMRTDSHNNPTAFTTDLAAQGGLVEGMDYTRGDSFSDGPNGRLYFTARLIGDPIALTIKVIDKVGFYAASSGQRWSYIGMPPLAWEIFSPQQKACIIGGMYHREGGTEMINLFPGQWFF